MTFEEIKKANETIVTTDVKGKQYAEVNQRIKAFRMLYPEGTIETELINIDNGICIMRAVIKNGELILGTGTAYEKEGSTFINKTSYIENCETSAVGRALGMAGFGIDVSVASAEEVQNAMQNQEVTQEEADNYKLTFGKHKGKTLKEVYKEAPDYIEWMLGNSNDERMLKLIQMATGVEIPTEEESQQRIALMSRLNELVEETECDYEALLKHYGVKTNNQMTIVQLQEAVNTLEKRVDNE